MNNYRFTKEWFLQSEIKRNLEYFLDKNKQNNILEIGCYEGMSSTFFADNFLDNEGSTMICVDPYLKIDDNDHKTLLQNNEESNFDHNMSICKNNGKITIHKITSDDFFSINKNTFNFIYVDGCHMCEFITRDLENSFNVLEKGGIMWMDDYLGGDGIQIKKTMEEFLEKYNGQYEVINKGYQLAIRKY
jgi:predicted O-methyltransferase YrrM